mmetsp:Transcript_64092/g.169870  ORF Transcript_64092/g.169870 Transcript_64092/m.169870 type:complete len:225 (-) Transcript_64092:231-905(-)
MVCIPTRTAPSMRVSGRRTSSTGKVWSTGQTGQDTRASTKTEARLGRDSSSGQTGRSSSEILRTTTSKGEVRTNGAMAVRMRVSGSRTGCMARAPSRGLMDGRTTATIGEISRMVGASSDGPTADSTTGSGATGSSTGQGFTALPTGSIGLANGTAAVALGGTSRAMIPTTLILASLGMLTCDSVSLLFGARLRDPRCVVLWLLLGCCCSTRLNSHLREGGHIW